MPDETIESPEEKGIEEIEHTEEEAQRVFSEAFKEASGEKVPEEKEKSTKEVKVEKPDKEEEKPEEGKKVEGKEEEKEDKGEKKGSEEDKKEDDISKRGTEILKKEEEEAKAAEEARVKAEEEKKEAEAKAQDENITPLNEADAQFFLNLIPPSRLPDTLKVGDVEYDLKTYMEDNPEVSLIGALQAQEFLINLVDRGALWTGEQVQNEIKRIQSYWSDEFFGLATIVELQNMGHVGVNVDAIVESKGFKDWGEKEDDKIKALFRSNKPRDYASGLNKYLHDTGFAKSKKQAKAHDEDALKKKKEHDDIYSNTMDTKRGSADLSGDSGEAEYSRAFKEAIEKAEKARKKANA